MLQQPTAHNYKTTDILHGSPSAREVSLTLTTLGCDQTLCNEHSKKLHWTVQQLFMEDGLQGQHDTENQPT